MVVHCVVGVLQGVNNPIPQKITSHKIVSLETECNTKAWVSSGVGVEIAEGMYIISAIISNMMLTGYIRMDSCTKVTSTRNKTPPTTYEQ